MAQAKKKSSFELLKEKYPLSGPSNTGTKSSATKQTSAAPVAAAPAKRISAFDALKAKYPLSGGPAVATEAPAKPKPTATTFPAGTFAGDYYSGIQGHKYRQAQNTVDVIARLMQAAAPKLKTNAGVDVIDRQMNAINMSAPGSALSGKTILAPGERTGFMSHNYAADAQKKIGENNKVLARLRKWRNAPYKEADLEDQIAALEEENKSLGNQLWLHAANDAVYWYKREKSTKKPAAYTKDNLPENAARILYLAEKPSLTAEEREEAKEIVRNVEFGYGGIPKTLHDALTSAGAQEPYVALQILAEKTKGSVADTAGRSFAEGFGLQDAAEATKSLIRRMNPDAISDYSERLSQDQANALKSLHPVASTVGNIAGNVAKHLLLKELAGGIIGAASGGTSGAVTAAKGVGSINAMRLTGSTAKATASSVSRFLADPYVSRLATTALTFGLSSAVSNLGEVTNNKMSAGEYAGNVAVSSLGGIIGGAASGLVNSGITKALIADPKKQTAFFEFVRNAAASSAFSVANQGTELAYDALRGKKIDKKQVAMNLASSFAFAMISSAIGTMKSTNAAKSALIAQYDKLKEYDAQIREIDDALQSNEQYYAPGSEAAQQLAARRIMLLGQANQTMNNIRDALSSTYYAGQAKTLKDINDYLDVLSATYESTAMGAYNYGVGGNADVPFTGDTTADQSDKDFSDALQIAVAQGIADGADIPSAPSAPAAPASPVPPAAPVPPASFTDTTAPTAPDVKTEPTPVQSSSKEAEKDARWKRNVELDIKFTRDQFDQSFREDYDRATAAERFNKFKDAIGQLKVGDKFFFRDIGENDHEYFSATVDYVDDNAVRFSEDRDPMSQTWGKEVILKDRGDGNGSFAVGTHILSDLENGLGYLATADGEVLAGKKNEAPAPASSPAPATEPQPVSEPRETVPAAPTRTTPQQPVSVPVMEAIDQVMDGERVTNRVADEILQDEEAVAYLQSEAGLEITDGMTNSQKREAVRTAVNSLVGTVDITAQENGTQTTQEAPAAQENRTPAQQVADIGQTLNLGTNGMTALTEQYDGESDPAAYAQAMTVVYNDAVAVTRGEERNQAAVDAAYNALTEEQREAAYRAGIADAQDTLETKASTEYDNYINNEVTEGTTYGQGDTGNGQGSVRGERNDAAQQGEAVAGGAAQTGGVNDQGGVAEAAGGGRKGDAWSPRRGKTPEARNLVYGREVTDSELGVKTDPSAPKVRAVTSGETPAMKRANATMQRVGKLIGAKVRSLFFGGSDLSIVEEDGSVSRGVEAFSQAWRNFVALPADHPGITVDRFAGHEGMEELLSHGAVKLNEVVDAVRDIIGNDVFDEAVGVYRSIYHSDDTAHWTKEFICDGAGNINRQTAYVDVSDSPLLQARAQLLDVVLETIHTHLNEITDGAFSDVPPLESQMTDESDLPFTSGETVSDEVQQTITDVGVQYDADSESANATEYSLKTWKLSDYVQKRNEAAKEIAKILGVSEKTAKKYIDDINSVAKAIANDRTRLDYEAAEGVSSVVSNVEYGGSVDFSTICKKRRLLTGTFEAIQKAIPDTVLTVDDVLQIRDIMKKAGYEVSCGLCYVEGSRAKMGEYGKHFVDLYKKYHPDAKWFPNMYDVTTPTGAEKMRVNHPEAYKEYEYFWNHYGKLREGDPNLFASQQKPKLFQAATEYNGEILKLFKGDETVAEKNRNGGLRLQSFSDFEIIHLIDTMQVIMDMSRVGLAGHAYTKVPDFAWAVGSTGLKVNLSLIAKGVDENGRIILDEVEGMPRAEAEKLRKAYSKNVGTILVTFNDEQLKAALNDPFIDFIIPFHRSQWAAQYYGILGLPAKVQDATMQQSEKLIEQTYHKGKNGQLIADKAKNFMPNEYWDFSKTGKENAENYLRLCAENNKRPKFSNLLVNNGDGSYSLQPDGSTDGYWKLLIDFKMYDNNGKGSPQMPVVPKFNMEQAMRMLDEYKGGHEKFPVAQDVVDKFLSEYSVAPPQGERGVDAALARQLEQARKRADYWRKQTKSNTKALTNIAKDAVTTYNSNVKAADLLPRLRSLVQNMMRSKGTDEDFVAIQEEARDIARDIINGSEVLQGDQQDYFADIRSRLQDTQIFLSRADADSIENYADFRRHLPRYFHITTETRKSAADFFGLNGKKSSVTTNVGTVYDGLRADFPWLFPELSSAGEQLQQIASVMKSIEPIYVNPYSETMAEAITWCANDIINAITRDDITPTVADRQDAKLSAEKQRGKEALAALRQASQKNLDEALTAEREKQQKRLEELRADRDKKLADLKQHHRDVAEDKRQRKMISDIGSSLLKIMRQLNSMHMSTENRTALQAIIGDYDLTSKTLTDAMRTKLQGLQDYLVEKKKDTNYIPNSYVENAVDRLYKQHIGDLKPADQLALLNVLKNFKHNLETQNQFISSSIRMELDAAASATIQNIRNSKGSKKTIIRDVWLMNQLSPESAMHLFTGYVDDDPLYIATKELSKGGLRQIDYQRRAYAIFDRFLKDDAFMDSISGSKAKLTKMKVRKVDGSEVEIALTPAMRISLYLASMNNKNLLHIRDGGVRIPDPDLYRKGELQEAMKHGVRVKLEPSTVRRIALGDPRNGIPHLSDKEKSFARAAWRYFNEFSSPEVSKASEDMDGFAHPMEDNYFPIDSDGDFLLTDFASIKKDGTLSGVGWMKERVEGANNPIYLYDADFVVKKAIDAHSKYVGMLIPVRNFTKLWNASMGFYDENGKYEPHVLSVREAMGDKWGTSGEDYVERMLKSVQFSGEKQTSIEAIMRKALSAYAGAVLTFTPGTAVMQMTSFPAAAYIVGWEPLAKAFRQKNLNDTDLKMIQSYTPILWYRTRGYIDPEFGSLTESGKAKKGFANMIQGADLLTTKRLWIASEYYVRDHFKGLEVGSPEQIAKGESPFYQKVAEVYEDVIRKTQPNYTPMERPQILKSNSVLERSLVMFATQRFQNFNILYDSLGKMRAEKTRWINTGEESAKQAYKNAARAASRAIWSQLAASFAFALVTAARDFLRGRTKKYRWRDKDLKDTWWWSVPAGLARNMLENGFGMFIFGNEIITKIESIVDAIAKGISGSTIFDAKEYGITISVLETINDISDDINKLAEKTSALAADAIRGKDVNVEDLLRTTVRTAEDVGKVTGKPVSNVKRLLEVVGIAVLKYAVPLLNPERAHLSKYYALRTTVDPDKSKGEYYELLYKAYKSNAEDYRSLYDLMLKDGFTEKGIKNAMEKKMKQEQGVKTVKDLSHRYEAP